MIFVVVIVYTAYSTVKKVFLEQSRIQQESISPFFSLMVEDILHPLHVAETLQKSKELTSLLNNLPANKEKLVATLKEYEDDIGLPFFAINNAQQIKYFSDGRQIDLSEIPLLRHSDTISPYKEFTADVIDTGSIQLFFQFKLYSQLGQPVGSIGVGKDMQHFLAKIQSYKQQYGFDFLFLNEKDQILLATEPSLLIGAGELKTLNDLPWIPQIPLQQRDALNSLLIEQDDKTYLLSEVKIKHHNWRIVVLLPLESDKNNLNQIFINNFLTIITVLLVFVSLVYLMSRYLGRKIANHVDIDHLSQLPNRRFVERKFKGYLDNKTELSLIVLDIDHFKSINDNYGHNVGDIVIREISKILADAVRTNDIAARWGGEEFVLILPGASFKIAIDIAERIRRIISKTDFHIEDEVLHITASFGVTYSEGMYDLIDMVDVADDLLYKAKGEGRNRVRAALPSEVEV